MILKRLAFQLVWCILVIPIALYYIYQNIVQSRSMKGLRDKLYLTKRAAKETLGI